MKKKSDKNEINYAEFTRLIKSMITFDIREFSTPQCLDDFCQRAYIEYKKFIRELRHLEPSAWIEFFYEEHEIETHYMCLSSKLKGLKDLALKNKKKR